MPLIDRDTLIGGDLFGKKGCTGNCSICNLHTDNGCRVILEAPTVDAVPVVHGKWEKKEVFKAEGIIEEMQVAQCGVCGKFHTTPYLYYFDDYNYCPNCGAKMVRRETDETD